MTSAYNLSKDIETCKRHGFDCYILREEGNNDLNQAVRNLTEANMVLIPTTETPKALGLVKISPQPKRRHLQVVKGHA